jgi:hypothetical protein
MSAPQVKRGSVIMSIGDGKGGWIDLKPVAEPELPRPQRLCCGRIRSEAGSPYLAFKCADCPL